jgi:hypothetical protein
MKQRLSETLVKYPGADFRRWIQRGTKQLVVFVRSLFHRTLISFYNRLIKREKVKQTFGRSEVLAGCDFFFFLRM